MQFLVIEKVNTSNGLSPELYRQVPAILDAIKDYNGALTKQGKVKATYALAENPGAAFVLDVADATELTRILASSPSNAFPLTREVHPVSDLASNLAVSATSVRDAIAHQDAMTRTG